MASNAALIQELTERQTKGEIILRGDKWQSDHLYIEKWFKQLILCRFGLVQQHIRESF